MREAVRSGSLEASVPIEEASRAGAAVVSLRVPLETPDLPFGDRSFDVAVSTLVSAVIPSEPAVS